MLAFAILRGGNFGVASIITFSTSAFSFCL
jgi:hypothetical protein